MSREVLLLVDALAREKNVDKDVVFGALNRAWPAVSQMFTFTVHGSKSLAAIAAAGRRISERSLLSPRGRIGRIQARRLAQNQIGLEHIFRAIRGRAFPFHVRHQCVKCQSG